jgi:exodeoxyribonuclease-1
MNNQREDVTFLWYDLETFGLNSRFDRIAQFAAIRTTLDFKPVGEALIYYSKLSKDYLPNIGACLVTGITPQECEEKGMSEELFISKINDEFSTPNTIVVGFNSIKFDDEFIRNSLYRNLEDPYKREYSNGCSRWDLLPLVRATHDLRPDNINWPPKKENNTFSFRLTELTEANNIEQVGAHDALVDVRATIAIAKLISEKQPRLFNWSLNLRKKFNVQKQLTSNEGKMLAVCDTKFTSEFGCTTLALNLTEIPNSSNVYMFDLTKDVTPLINASSKTILDVEGLFHIAVNKCPFISPANVIDKETAKRNNIDLELCQRNADLIKQNPEIINHILDAVNNSSFDDEVSDVDFKIYSGFFSYKDKDAFKKIKSAPVSEKLQILKKTNFEDSRAKDLSYRYICRNFEKQLPEDEKNKWIEFCKNRIENPPLPIENNLEAFKEELITCRKDTTLTQRQDNTLKLLESYMEDVLHKLENKEL